MSSSVTQETCFIFLNPKESASVDLQAWFDDVHMTLALVSLVYIIRVRLAP